jgi:hypothetical protein
MRALSVFGHKKFFSDSIIVSEIEKGIGFDFVAREIYF